MICFENPLLSLSISGPLPVMLPGTIPELPGNRACALLACDFGLMFCCFSFRAEAYVFCPRRLHPAETFWAAAWPRNLTKNKRFAVIYNFAMSRRGPSPARKSYKKLAIPRFVCPKISREGWTAPWGLPGSFQLFFCNISVPSKCLGRP